MNHFNPDASAFNRRTPAPWRIVGTQVGQLTNRWADRGDIVAYIGDEASSSDAAALFIPSLAEVQVNTIAAFGHIDPSLIEDITIRKNQYAFPAAVGAIYHEAMHAKHTTWSLDKAARDLTYNQNEAMHTLEETRIERLGVKELPKNRSFLRSCALNLVLGDTSPESLEKVSTVRYAARNAALALARVDAGILKEKDVTNIREVVTKILGEDLLQKLMDINLEFQQITDTRDYKYMYKLAKKWDKLINDEAQNRGEEDKDGNPTGSNLPQEIQDILDALGMDAGMTTILVQKDLDNEETTERNAEVAKKKAEEAAEKGTNKKVAEIVFGQNPQLPNGSTTNSRPVSHRAPTATERVAAVTVAHALDKAKYRDRIRVETTDATPPGRLRSGAFIQQQAYYSKGLYGIETQPWRRAKHQHVDDPTLKIGVIVDISGSMGDAMEPMASTAWILSEAVKKTQGTAAMVYFGASVFPTLKPGQHLNEVVVYDAPDSHHNWSDAFKAVDGGLNLLYGEGARMLVVVSDGAYSTPEIVAMERWMKRCEEQGVAVLWLGYGRATAAKEHCTKTNAVFVQAPTDVAGVAATIARSATEALRSADQVCNGGY